VELTSLGDRLLTELTPAHLDERQQLPGALNAPELQQLPAALNALLLGTGSS
jgi:hypothetical protein